MTIKEWRRWQRFHWSWVKEDWRHPAWRRGWVHYNGLPGLLDPIWERPWWRKLHDKFYCAVWRYKTKW